MHIGHKQILTREIARLKGDGTTYNIRITLNQFATIHIHAFRLINMLQQIVIHITCTLLYAQQDIVDILHSTLKCQLGIAHSLVLQRLMGEVEQYAQRYR